MYPKSTPETGSSLLLDFCLPTESALPPSPGGWGPAQFAAVQSTAPGH